MDNEKEIIKITKIIEPAMQFKCCPIGKDLQCSFYDDYGIGCIECNIAQTLYNAGYRKADEVSKETASKILEEVSKHFGGGWLAKLYKDYGIE